MTPTVVYVYIPVCRHLGVTEVHFTTHYIGKLIVSARYLFIYLFICVRIHSFI